MLNQVRFQFSRYEDVRRDLQPGLYINRSGYSLEGGFLGPFGFGVSPENTWEAANVLSYRRGRHGYRIGGGAKYVRAHNETLGYGRGAYFFAGPPSSAPAPYAFVQGFGTESAATADPRSLSIHGFVQDDWAVASGLTVNYGVRYDVERISNVLHFGASADTNNVQPRVGVAWQVFPGRTIVRGGAGIYSQQQLLGYISRVELEGVDGTTLLTLAPESSAMPVFPNVLPSTLSVLPPRDIVILDSGFRNPRSVQMMIGVDHPMAGSPSVPTSCTCGAAISSAWWTRTRPLPFGSPRRAPSRRPTRRGRSPRWTTATARSSRSATKDRAGTARCGSR
jgi:hypothetical protein